MSKLLLLPLCAVLSFALLVHAAEEGGYTERSLSRSITFLVYRVGTSVRDAKPVSRKTNICPSDYPRGFSIVCNVPKNVLKYGTLAIMLNDKTVRVERYRPFSIAGDNPEKGGKIRPWTTYPKNGGKITCVTSQGFYNSLEVTFSCESSESQPPEPSDAEESVTPEASVDPETSAEESPTDEDPESSADASPEPTSDREPGSGPTSLPFSTVPVSPEDQKIEERPGLRYPSKLPPTE